ncbi:hypothetical protein F5X96DRAFT_651010 [Biscogniauxia mediterranea]|nr:hypothetical protein F5X96DRAFT_651010 [Biscogniauxia mediterranea]
MPQPRHIFGVIVFVCNCRGAREDLATINGELSELSMVLELLKEGSAINGGTGIPENLRVQILSLVKNCTAVVGKINDVLEKHKDRAGIVKWVDTGKAEVAGLRTALEAHRQSLNMALEQMAATISKVVKEDTTAIRADVVNIKQDTSRITLIIQELARIRALVGSNMDILEVSSHGNILQRI